MSAGIAACVDALLTTLAAAEISAAADPADLDTPGVLVAVDTISPNLMSGDGTVTLRLNLCVANGGWRDALSGLDDLLAAVSDVVDLDATVFPETLIVSGAELPSLRATSTAYYERT